MFNIQFFVIIKKLIILLKINLTIIIAQKMDLDCILNNLLYCDLSTIKLCLMTNKNIKLLENNYTWKLLGERDYGEILKKNKKRQFSETYKLSYNLNNFCNKFDRVPWRNHNFSQMIDIKNLNYYDVELEIIPQGLILLSSLTQLNLGHNKIKSISSELMQMINLKELTLFDNNLNQIPTELGQLTNLTILKLGGNPFEYLPSELGNLIKLTYMGFSQGNLKYIPMEFGKLINLRTVYMNINHKLPIEWIPLKRDKILSIHTIALTIRKALKYQSHK